MVQWLHPRVLLGAAREVVVSGLFARFADKREGQAALDAAWFDASGFEGPLWLDYASDTGDGFEPTYAVASLLGRDRIELGGEELPRGRLLVLGGDQVYPAAEWEAYQERFVEPYTAALPYIEDQRARPLMFALPGNHDWYDGLTSFMRLFCAQRSIGAWQTVQSRSYFAIELPGGWWLWAVDTQLDTYIDYPQLSYFWEMAGKLRPGDRVILVTAKPSWVAPSEDEPGWNTMASPPEAEKVPQSWQTLAFLEGRVIANRATLALTLTGDLHHYSHYRGSGDQAERHKVTSGGAGAFLSATHPLPDEIHLPDHDCLRDAATGGRRAWRLERTFPSKTESEYIARGVFWPPISLHTPSFAAMTAVIYGILGACAWWSQESTAAGYALCAVIAGLLVWGLGQYADRRLRNRLGWGLGHAALHLVPLSALIVVLLALLDAPAWVLVPAALALGFVWAPIAFAGYLRLAHALDRHAHATELMAAQSRAAGKGYKNFLRIRIDPDGRLTVYPLGVRAVPEVGEWEAVEEPRSPSDAWFALRGFERSGPGREIEVELIGGRTIKLPPPG